MSSDSPKPPSPEHFKQLVETLVKHLDWVAELILHRQWSNLLLLIGVVCAFLFKPEGGLLVEKLQLPTWYKFVFWSIEILIALAALIIRVRTPSVSTREKEDSPERQAIKGLRPFTAQDVEIFRSLQREPALKRCFTTITDSHFHFGILMGLSGCGKTSFLQAGLIPRLVVDYKYRGVYVQFSDREPLATIRQALARQLEIPLTWLDSLAEEREEREEGSGFVPLLTQVVEAVESPVVLFFDQFEQWFVHYSQPEARKPLLEGLREWYNRREELQVKIIVSIRSDLFYYLNELQQALGYSLGPQDVFELKKFSPKEATEVLKAISRTEGLSFDSSFLDQLSKEELASKEDGLVSPVDLQIVAWIVASQNSSQLWGFYRQAFQQFGGVQELLNRYLEKALLALGSQRPREAAVKVLLALTDLDRQVRSGALTLEELEIKLNSTVPKEEIKEAVNWLKRGDVRLITSLEKREGIERYELAHERLIPAILKQSDRELTAASRANNLLERRVNEWVGNNRSNRYLFSFSELLLIERQKPYLVWGSKRRQKQRLLKLSKRRIYRFFVILLSLLLLVGGFLGWLQFTPQGQIQQVGWSIENPLGRSLERVDDDIAVQAAVAIAKEGRWQYAFKLVREQVQKDPARRDFLSEFSKVVGRDDSNQAQAQLQQALALAKEIEDPYYQSKVLRAIASAYGQLDNDSVAGEVLKESFNAAKEIEDPYYQSKVLRAIASAYGQLDNDSVAGEGLKQSLKAAKEIEDPRLQSSVLSAIAWAYGQLDNDSVAQKVLKESFNAAKEIEDPQYQSEVLREIASVYGQLEDYSVAGEGLKESLKAAKEIEDPQYQSEVLREIASVYGQLEDYSVAGEGLKESLKAAKEIEDPRLQSSVLREIASAYGQLDNDSVAGEGLQESLKAAKEIEDPRYRSWVLSAIASAYGQLKDYSVAGEVLKESLKAAKEIEDPRYRSWVLSAIASAYGQLKDYSVAGEVLKESLNAAKEIEDPQYQSSVLSAIASAYGQLKDYSVAQEGLKESLNAAKEIEDPQYQSLVLSAIASAYGQLKDYSVAGEGLKESLNAAKEIEDPQYQSSVLSAIAWAYGQLKDYSVAGEGLKESLNAAKEIEDPQYQSLVLRDIASAYKQIGDDSVAQKGLKESLNAAKEMDSNSDNFLKAIAAATGNINNPNIRQSILQDTLPIAEANNASSALAEISYQYALDGFWGKALNALKRCRESEKVAALANILSLYAEQQKPQLIDGAVVLKIETKPTANQTNSYTFTLSIQKNNEEPKYYLNRGEILEKPKDYIDRWEILTEKGELIHQEPLNKSHSNQQSFSSTNQKPITLDSPQQVIIIRARMKPSFFYQTGYEARQAWKGSMEKGFKLIRLSPNFATNK